MCPGEGHFLDRITGSKKSRLVVLAEGARTRTGPALKERERKNKDPGKTGSRSNTVITQEPFRIFFFGIYLVKDTYLLDPCDVIPRTPGRSIVGISVPVLQSSVQIILALLGFQHTPNTTQIHK